MRVRLTPAGASGAWAMTQVDELIAALWCATSAFGGCQRFSNAETHRVCCRVRISTCRLLAEFRQEGHRLSVLSARLESFGFARVAMLECLTASPQSVLRQQRLVDRKRCLDAFGGSDYHQLHIARRITRRV
jgi:hypothetical protein